jgi:hypothetical protein
MPPPIGRGRSRREKCEIVVHDESVVNAFLRLGCPTSTRYAKRRFETDSRRIGSRRTGKHLRSPHANSSFPGGVAVRWGRCWRAPFLADGHDDRRVESSAGARTVARRPVGRTELGSVGLRAGWCRRRDQPGGSAAVNCRYTPENRRGPFSSRALQSGRQSSATRSRRVRESARPLAAGGARRPSTPTDWTRLTMTCRA